jgi:hypothetical protein
MRPETFQRLQAGLALTLAALAPSLAQGAKTPPNSAAAAQFLVHEASGLCLDVSGAPGTANGAALQLWACETQGNRDNGSTTDQKWYFQNGFVRNGLSGKCMDVPGAPGVKPGSKMNLWDCELSGRSPNGAQTDQQFDYKDGQLRSRVSGLCVGPERTEYEKNGVRLVLTRCSKPGSADLEYSFRTPDPTPAAAPTAAKPAAVAPVAAKPGKPQMIYPDVPGASQTCLIPVDPMSRRFKVAVGSALVLSAKCSPSQGAIFLVAKDAIRVAGKPNLCVNISAGAHAAQPYLENCADTEVKNWDVGGSSSASARIRSVGGLWDNQCWSVRDIQNDRARYPLDVDAVACRPGKDPKFFISAD